MHLKSHVIMQLALGLTVSASISACQKSRKTIDEVQETALPRFESEVPQDESPNVVTVEDPTPVSEPVESIAFDGDNCPFCGMG